MNNPKETKETFDQLLYAGPITVKCESCATVLSFVEGSANSIFAHYDQHNGYCPHDVNVGDVDEDWLDWEADQNQQAQDPGENNPQQFKMLSTAQMSDPTKVPGIGTATAKHIIAALQAQPPPTNWREFESQPRTGTGISQKLRSAGFALALPGWPPAPDMRIASPGTQQMNGSCRSSAKHMRAAAGKKASPQGNEYRA